MYSQVSPVVQVYAPPGPELNANLKLIDQYNHSLDHPTQWKEKVYVGGDYLNRMIADKKGNVVVLAGNNRNKSTYISRAVEAGYHVLSDKPMAIDARGFEVLKGAFEKARQRKVLLYDIMTERNEIHAMLQKTLMQQPAVFGQLVKGTLKHPAVIKKSVHHFFKTVSGSPLIRPVWYYDTDQEGDGLVDVTTHLVDLVQWQCFPDQVLDYRTDIRMLEARRWPTSISALQFKLSTGQASWPGYLKRKIKNGHLQVYANGSMDYTIRGVHAQVAVCWNFQSPGAGGDIHYSVVRGSRANLIIRQGKEQSYMPELYIEPVDISRKDYLPGLNQAIDELGKRYPGLSLQATGRGWKVKIPEKFKTDHETQFSLVTKKYLQYVQQGSLPSWEVPAMLAKYYTTTSALEMAMQGH